MNGTSTFTLRLLRAIQIEGQRLLRAIQIEGERLLRAIQIEGQRLLRCACCKPMP